MLATILAATTGDVTKAGKAIGIALIPVVGVAAVFYLFEVVIVVSLQAFIFAALSAIYIGSAIEPEH